MAERAGHLRHLLLQHAHTRVVLDAGHGGAVREFSWRGREIFRTTASAATEDPLEFSCFPMVPYVNRIAGGRFHFQGREIRLARNWENDLHPLHGQGWRAPWALISAAPASAVLRLEAGGDEWPWRYRCEQHFEVGGDGLTIALSIENLASSAMPAALGLHPYFADAAGARLQAHLPRVWLTDEQSLPTQRVHTPAAWSFDVPRPITAVPLDHCFCGWDAAATVSWPQYRLSLHADHCPHLHIYAPAGRDFFCLEPQTAAVGALNRGDEELRALRPGEQLQMTARFHVEGGC